VDSVQLELNKTMAKEKLTGIDSIIQDVESAIAKSKEEYAIKATNPMYSVITDLELTLMELKKLK
jgi:hypothetical protein